MLHFFIFVQVWNADMADMASDKATDICFGDPARDNYNVFENEGLNALTPRQVVVLAMDVWDQKNDYEFNDNACCDDYKQVWLGKLLWPLIAKRVTKRECTLV